MGKLLGQDKVGSSFRVAGKHVVVRRLESSDYLAWVKAHTSQKPKQNAFDTGPVPKEQLTRAIFEMRLKFFQQGREQDLLYIYGIFHRHTKELLGFVDAYIITRLDCQSANLGYKIFNQHWRNGYATEAVKLVMPIFFKKLHIHRLEAGIEAHNKASIKMMSKLGLRYEGERKKFYHRDGKWLDLKFYAITPEMLGLPAPAPKVCTKLVDYMPMASSRLVKKVRKKEQT